ncbi:hypothetical protein TWF103_008905 [Orbilia oligospora]|nr:hypothetical protein TWF103_008905 [Orbilia oligospora]
MSGPSAAPFDAARAEKLHQDLGSEIRKLGNMPALQGFDDLQRRLEETINGAVERAVTAAVERAVTAAVERAVTAAVDRAVTAAVDRAVEQAFENFRRDNDARESLTSARLHNARIDDTAPLWFPSDVLDAGALHTHIPNKMAIDVLSLTMVLSRQITTARPG